MVLQVVRAGEKGRRSRGTTHASKKQTRAVCQSAWSLHANSLWPRQPPESDPAPKPPPRHTITTIRATHGPCDGLALSF